MDAAASHDRLTELERSFRDHAAEPDIDRRRTGAKKRLHARLETAGVVKNPWAGLQARRAAWRRQAARARDPRSRACGRSSGLVIGVRVGGRPRPARPLLIAGRSRKSPTSGIARHRAPLIHRGNVWRRKMGGGPSLLGRAAGQNSAYTLGMPRASATDGATSDMPLLSSRSASSAARETESNSRGMKSSPHRRTWRQHGGGVAFDRPHFRFDVDAV